MTPLQILLTLGYLGGFGAAAYGLYYLLVRVDRGSGPPAQRSTGIRGRADAGRPALEAPGRTGSTPSATVDSGASRVAVTDGDWRGPVSIAELLFSFDGRINRSEYLLTVVIFLPLAILNWVLASVDSDVANAAAIVIGLISIWPASAVLIKRWHDRNRSASWLLTLLVPFVNFVALPWIVVEVYFLKGTEGPNRFGADPVSPMASSDVRPLPGQDPGNP